MTNKTSYTSIDMAHAEEKAKKRSCEVYHNSKATTDTLMLDLDGPAGAQKFLDNITLVRKHLADELSIAIETYQYWKSNSGKGLHVLVVLDTEVDIADSLVIQAALGSDTRREFISWLRKTMQEEGRDLGFGNDCRTLFKPQDAIVCNGYSTLYEACMSMAAKVFND